MDAANNNLSSGQIPQGYRDLLDGLKAQLDPEANDAALQNLSSALNQVGKEAYLKGLSNPPKAA